MGDAMSDPRSDKSRAAFHQELIAATIDRRKKLDGASYNERELNPQQRGYLAAKAGLSFDDQIPPEKLEAAKVEAMRILCAMLGKNPTLAMMFKSSGIQVVVVSANRLMTDLPEFSSLGGVQIQQAGVSGASRTWDKTRGVGGLVVGNKMYVAVTEENLVGGGVGPAVQAVGGGCYAAGYSTTSHEFAHAMHLKLLSPKQKTTITNAYKERCAGLVIANNTIYFDGDAAALKTAAEKPWVDGPRTALPTAVTEYHVSNAAGSAWQPWKYRSDCKPTNCYAAVDEREYFAQCVNAYLGANAGVDPYTKRPRNNGQAWIRVNEPKAMVALLDSLFSPHGASDQDFSGFGAAEIPDTNTPLPQQRQSPTLAEVIAQRKAANVSVKSRVAMFEQLAQQQRK